MNGSRSHRGMIMKPRQFNVGDRVAFSRAFLQSTFQFSGWVPFARGTIIGLVDCGPVILAEVQWDGRDMGNRVLTSNLVHANRIHLEPV